MSAANKLVSDGKPFEAVCWSLQEHAFAACIEVAERALAHTGKLRFCLAEALHATKESETCLT